MGRGWGEEGGYAMCRVSEGGRGGGWGGGIGGVWRLAHLACGQAPVIAPRSLVSPAL